MRPLRYLDVCSGYSACTIGWQGLAFECAGYAEIDPGPCAVLAHRYGAGRPRHMPQPDAVLFPDDTDPLDAAFYMAAKRRVQGKTQAVLDKQFIAAWEEREQRRKNIRALDFIKWGDRIPNYGDFTTIGGQEDVGPIDLLIGGTPCQGFSIAGQRLGLRDPRGHLTLEFLALAKRLRPRWLVWENVPGFLSLDDGDAMATFTWLLGELGYGWAYRVLDAQFIRVDGFEGAVPQRRRRLFFVGYLGAGAPARAVLFDPSSLSWDPAPRREAGAGVAGSITSRAGGGGWPDGGDGRAEQLIPTVARSLLGEGFDASEDGTGRGTPIIPILEMGKGTGSRGAAQNGTGIGQAGDPMFTLQAGAKHGIAVPSPLSAPICAGGNMSGGTRQLGSVPDQADCLVPVVCPPLRAGGKEAGHSMGACADTAESLIPIHCPEIVPQSVSSKWHKGSSGPAGDECANLVAFSIMPMNSSRDFKAREADVAQPVTCGPSIKGAQGGDLVVAFSLRGRDGENIAEPAEPGIVNALRGASGGSTHAFVAFTCKDMGQDAAFDVAPTLRSMAGERLNGGGQVAIAFNARQDPDVSYEVAHGLDQDGWTNGVALAFDTTQITHRENRSNPQPGDPCFSLPTTGHPPAIVFKMGPGPKARGIAASSIVAPTLGAADGNQGAPGLAVAYKVRRLTPRECERLQGAPDDFTLTPYRNGKPMSDSARYKMVGNSQASNVMRWIGHGLEEAERQLRAAGMAE